jgi:hypothetical protein
LARIRFLDRTAIASWHGPSFGDPRDRRRVAPCVRTEIEIEVRSGASASDGPATA